MPVIAFEPAVRFGDGRRPETATQVQVAEFEGPLGLLLSLIEARKLDVLTRPARAPSRTPTSMRSPRSSPIGIGNVSAFVAVAGQLILIKSRAMLPRPPAIDPSLGRR